MSRRGNTPIKIPDGTTITVDGLSIRAKGKHGELDVEIKDSVGVEIEDKSTFTRRKQHLFDQFIVEIQPAFERFRK